MRQIHTEDADFPASERISYEGEQFSFLNLRDCSVDGTLL